ncbi:MAG TPA: hypothetical protein VGR26_11415 [Acidimicrobiales bacterium]|nr:hypothetical protein [Acidimicrobiales bacterium]
MVLLSVTALVLAGLGQRFADATDHETTVTAVEGSAFGCFASTSFSFDPDNRPPPTVFGPVPSVELPPGGSAEPITATAPECTISVGAFEGAPTVISTGPLSVSTQGTTGPTGSVTSTATITDVGVDPNEAFQAAGISSTCTANETGVTGSTTVTGGTIDTGTAEGVVDVPLNPEPGETVFVDVGPGTANYIFNEQTVDPVTGAITVNALRIQTLEGPLQGEVIIGQVVCDITTAAQETTTTTTVPEETTTTTVPEETTTTTVPEETTTTTVPQETTTTTVPQETTTTTVGAACVPFQDNARPGHGYGDKNHRHCGPPGQTGDRPPGKPEQGLDARPVASSRNLPPAWLLAGLGLLFLAPLVVPFGRSRRGDRRA